MKLGGLEFYLSLGCEGKSGDCGFYFRNELHVVVEEVDGAAAAVSEIIAEEAVKIRIRRSSNCLLYEKWEAFIGF